MFEGPGPGAPRVDEITAALSRPPQLPTATLVKVVALVAWAGWFQLSLAVAADEAPTRTPPRLPGLRRHRRGAPRLHPRCQGVGLTLGEIRGILALRHQGRAPCAHVLELLVARSAEVSGASASTRFCAMSSGASPSGTGPRFR